MEYFVALIIYGPGVVWILLRVLGAVKPSRMPSATGSAEDQARGAAWFIAICYGSGVFLWLFISIFGTVDVTDLWGFIGGLVMGLLSVWLGYQFANWLVFGSNNPENNDEH